MTIALQSVLRIRGALTTAGDGGTAQLPIEEGLAKSVANGTGLDQANGLYIDDFSIAASGSLNIDLSGSLELATKKYDLMQGVNVRGTFLLSRSAIPVLKDAENPHILSLSPPLNPTPKWLGAHTGYTLAKFGMTMVTLGLAAEFARDGIAANTLWPRTTIATAAVQNLLGGDRVMAASRTPDIYADAAYAVLCKPAAEYTGQTLIVEDVLEESGVTDLSGYAAVPGTPDDRLFPDIFLD